MLFIQNISGRRTLCAMGMALTALLIGCEDASPKPAPAEIPKTQANRDFETEAHNPTDRILISDEKISPDRSGERILGDQRPLYAIEGRVTSNLLYANADHILIKVYLVDSKLNILDTADITVDDIAPQGTKAFRRVVPLLPPQGKKFNYTLEIYSVKTSPALHPWPFLH
jgi:hypothetical protein